MFGWNALKVYLCIRFERKALKYKSLMGYTDVMKKTTEFFAD